MRLPYKDLLELKEAAGDLEEGETTNVHHCKDGRNNDRCYVTNKGECWLFYCHHCGGYGKLNEKLATFKRKTKESSTTSSLSKLPNSFNLPSTGESDVRRWPVEARMWTQRASLTREQIEEVGMLWDERSGRVCIPISFNGEYRGYVARLIRGDGPKYLARRNDVSNFIYAKHCNPSSVVILVEDILSCIKLYYCGYNAVALQGTSIDDTLFNYVTKHYKEFVVWLDNDNAQVKINQVKLLTKLKLFGKTKIVKTPKDPKEYNKEEIDKWLRV